MHEIPAASAADDTEHQSDTGSGGRLGELSCPDDWRTFVDCHANTLIIGARAAIADLLRRARPWLRGPISTASVSELCACDGAGTVIVHDVDRLDREDQRALLHWIASPPSSQPRIVSTATRPIFPLVATGAFDEELYYHLNKILLEVVSPAGLDVSGRRPA